MRPSLTIIIASSGRPSLQTTLDSFTSQLHPGDQCIIDVNDDAPWGHKARNRSMELARGDGILFIDDDDMYFAGALDIVRGALEIVPDRPHIFRMLYNDGRQIWQRAGLVCGNVSTQMFVVPNIKDKLGRWGDRYEGDFDFIKSTCDLMGQPLWHEEVIAMYGRADA
jgi:glycosyltransferase involved in cell wall biosynthesis